MDKWRSGSSMVPGISHESGGLSQHRRWIHGAGRKLEAQFVAIVSQIADLEHEGDKVEGQEDDTGAHQPHEQVELQVGLLPLRPRKGQVE